MRLYECEFCEEADSGVCGYFKPPKSRLIWVSENFLSVPSIGPLALGHLLIIPKNHVQSFAGLDATEFQEALAFLKDVVTKLRARFGDLAMFEHGSFGASQSGACIEHAHIHVLPFAGSLRACLPEGYRRNQLTSWGELPSFAKVPYLLATRNIEPPSVIVRPKVGSQYFRKCIAREQGRPDEWDWAVFPNMELCLDIIDTLASSGPEMLHVRQVE